MATNGEDFTETFAALIHELCIAKYADSKAASNRELAKRVADWADRARAAYWRYRGSQGRDS